MEEEVSKKVVNFEDYKHLTLPEENYQQKEKREKKHKEIQRKKHNDSVLAQLSLGKYKRK